MTRGHPRSPEITKRSPTIARDDPSSPPHPPGSRRARGVDTLTLPYDEDGAEYYAILRRFVERYINAEVRCDDPLVAAWYSRLASLLPRADLPPLSSGSLADVIATFAHHVSALHGHVGQVAGEVEDPCFAPFAWREGELCGTPRQSLARASIMAATGHANPRCAAPAHPRASCALPRPANA